MSFWFYITIGFIAVILLIPAGNNDEEKHKGYIKKNKIFIVLSFLLLLFIIIFRDVSVGTDYKTYINLYNRILTDNLYVNDINWVGYPFYVIMKIFTLIFKDNYNILFGLLSFISLLLLYKTVTKESKIPWLSLLMFLSFCLYYQFFNQFRQMAAIMITFYAFRYLKENNAKKYFITIIIASVLHTSALIMLPVYFLKNVNINKNTILIYILIILGVFFGYEFIINILSKTSYGMSYFGTYRDTTFNTNTILNLFVRIIILLFCLLNKNRYIKNDSNGNIIINMLFICIIFQVLTLRSFAISRITTYFFIYTILAIPNILYYMKPKKKALYLMIIIPILFAYHYVYYFSSAGAEIAGYDNYSLIEIGGD